MAGALDSDFDISAKAGLTDRGYARMAPFVWPRNDRRRGGRFFGAGQFHTADGRGVMIAVTPRASQAPDAAFPFRLNTGRIRDQWHTMTRTSLSSRLSQHLAEPFLEIHPADAARLGLAPAALAEVCNDHGCAILRVLVTDRVAVGHPFAPMHWTGETAPSGRVDALVPGLTDPVSGQPASKSASVAIRPFAARWYGYAIARSAFRPDCAYWARAALPGGMQAELAGLDTPADWAAAARDLFGVAGDPLVVDDAARGLHRLAFLRDGLLQAALFIGPAPVALSRRHLGGLLGQAAGPAALAGRAGADVPDPGVALCACFNVGVNTITRAVTEQGLMTVEAIGEALRAGTNCGSCRPEIRALIAQNVPFREAAE